MMPNTPLRERELADVLADLQDTDAAAEVEYRPLIETLQRLRDVTERESLYDAGTEARE